MSEDEQELVQQYNVGAPPITSDPPVHTWARKLLLPPFSVTSVAKYEEETRELCNELSTRSSTRARGRRRQYAQQIPPRVIASMLGIDKDEADTFTGWVRGFLELGLTDPELREQSARSIFEYMVAQVQDRQETPKDDLISYLLAQEVDGEPVPPPHVVGTCFLLLVAGIDTTWSSIGSALWHLAQHPEHRKQLSRSRS